MVAEHYSDDSLVESIKQERDLGPVLRFLYRQHFEALRNYVEENKGTRQDAEDIFQEVLVAFIELVRIGKFRGEASVKTLLYAMNRNSWLNELKRRGRTITREKLYSIGMQVEDPGSQMHISARESRKQIMDVVESLGEVCKKILLGFYYENLSMREILETTGYENEQVVRNKKYKCLKQLEQMLNANPALAKTLKNALNYE